MSRRRTPSRDLRLHDDRACWNEHDGPWLPSATTCSRCLVRRALRVEGLPGSVLGVHGVHDSEPDTAVSAPTHFCSWCKEVLRPAVLAEQRRPAGEQDARRPVGGD